MITKFIRKYLMNGYVSIPLMLCFILTTWSSIASNKKLTYHLSGEEMFKGVFFMEGKYAELIPELKATKLTYFSEQLSAEENASMQAVRNQLIESIKADNPQFFNDFKAILQTGNPSSVKEELKKAQELLTEKALELSKMSEADLQKDTKAMSEFLKNHSNTKDKNALKKFVNNLDKDNASTDHSGRLLVILLVIAAVAAVVWAWVKVYDAAAEEVSTSKLMFEQVVGSICDVAPQVV